MITFFRELYLGAQAIAPSLFAWTVTIAISAGGLAVLYLGFLGLTKGENHLWAEELVAKVEPAPTVHRLKVHPTPFKALAELRKRFEFRKDDREYKVGDVLLLQEYDPLVLDEGKRYTGNTLLRVVTYKLPGGTFDVPPGYCVLSLREYP